jgi:hypothetical protein
MYVRPGQTSGALCEKMSKNFQSMALIINSTIRFRPNTRYQTNYIAILLDLAALQETNHVKNHVWPGGA